MLTGIGVDIATLKFQEIFINNRFTRMFTLIIMGRFCCHGYSDKSNNDNNSNTYDMLHVI